MKETSYNFGAIRDSIIRLSASEILKESNSVTLNSFTDRIKQNSALSKQHLIYKNIQDSKVFDKERLAERFLNQNIQLFVGEKWHNILSENKKLRKELMDDFHVEAKKDAKLFESIHTLIESVTKPGFNDFEREQEAYEYVLSHLTREVVSEAVKSEEVTDAPNLVGDAWKYITKMAVSNFNQRFSHLNESEKEAFKILISDNNTKINYLESLKEENVKTINEKLKEEREPKAIDILHTFKDKINKINHNDLDVGIISCLELKQNLK